MKRYPQPSGLQQGLGLLMAPCRTPEQAIAVFELLDDLRELISTYYQPIIEQYYTENRITEGELPTDDPPF